MKSNIYHSYDVYLFPEDDNDEFCISFHIELKKTSTDIVEFILWNSHMEDEPKYVGLLPSGIWYIDPSLYRGVTVMAPISYNKLVEELEAVDEYEEEQYYSIAKAIELIYKDSFGLMVVEDEKELPF